MGRIVVQLEIENLSEPEKKLQISAMVDTGASYLTRPLAWKDRLGKFPMETEETLYTADQSEIKGTVCGPAKIQIEAFRPISSEVLFVDMKDVDGHYEALLGYIPLEQSKAAVDMLGHRLVAVKALDLR